MLCIIVSAEMLVSCLGVALLALIYEGLKVLREYIDARSRCHCEEQHSGSSEKVSGDSGESACCQDSNTATITPQHHHKQCVYHVTLALVTIA